MKECSFPLAIYRVCVSCSVKGWSQKTEYYPIVKETEKSIIYGCNRRLSKSELLKPDSIISVKNHRLFSFFTFCYEQDIESAIVILKQHIINIANEVSMELGAVRMVMHNNNVWGVGNETPVDTTINRIMDAVIMGFGVNEKMYKQNIDRVKDQIRSEINWLLTGRQ